jgi:hypothetical protein
LRRAIAQPKAIKAKTGIKLKRMAAITPQTIYAVWRVGRVWSIIYSLTDHRDTAYDIALCHYNPFK